MPPDLQQVSSLLQDVSQLPEPLTRPCKEQEPSTSPYCEQEAWAQLATQTRVKHVKQLFSWDCGLACTLMVLRAAGIQCDYTLLRQLCPTTSIWTIDLAHLIRRFGVHTSFFTITLGPNPAFVNESFYMSSIEEDEARVSRLFRDAPAAGVAVCQRSVSRAELVAVLRRGDTLVIALVDKRKLDPWLMAADMCLPYALCGLGGDVIGYTGHYILLNGYDPGADEFMVQDPAQHGSGTEPARIGAAALDAARRAFGTDEDLLMLSHPMFGRHAVRTPGAHVPNAATPSESQGSCLTGASTSGENSSERPLLQGAHGMAGGRGRGTASGSPAAGAGSRKRAAAKGASSSSDSDTTVVPAPTRQHAAAANGQQASGWYAAWGSWGYGSMWGAQWGSSTRPQQATAVGGPHLATPMVSPVQQPVTPAAVTCSM